MVKTSIEFSDIVALKPAFEAALCPNEIGFTSDGYLSQCFTNTYLYAPVALILAIWGIAETKNINTNGHKANTLSGRINFLLACAYTVVVVQYGASIFNVISLPVSFFTLLIVFILSFMDLKGVNVPNKPLEVYFFLTAAVSGYLVVQFIGLKQFDEDLLAATYICLVSSIAGSARNIISAFDDAEREAIKKPKQD